VNAQIQYIADNFDTTLKAHIAKLDWDQFTDLLEDCDLSGLASENDYDDPWHVCDAHPQILSAIADQLRAAITDELMLEYDQIQLGGSEKIPTRRTRDEGRE
jgi:hypothetical protein